MKIILRILTLPFAWILWTIHYSYYWVKNGGELVIKDKPIIKPEEFYRLLTEVSERLKDFEAQKDETLHWKRLYENYDLEHCATFVKQHGLLEKCYNILSLAKISSNEEQDLMDEINNYLDDNETTN